MWCTIRGVLVEERIFLENWHAHKIEIYKVLPCFITNMIITAGQSQAVTDTE